MVNDSKNGIKGDNNAGSPLPVDDDDFGSDSDGEIKDIPGTPKEDLQSPELN